jgi:hypothetical protein
MNRNGAPKGPHRKTPTPTPTAYAGPTTCLRCEKIFESWDRRQNRLCTRCREAIAEGASEEPSYQLSPRQPRKRDDR